MVRWARALARKRGPEEVSWAHLPLVYKAFVGRALPTSAYHGVKGMHLRSGERAQVLKKPWG